MLLESIDQSYSAFEQYQALVAVRQLLGALSPDEMDALVTTALRVSSRDEVSGSDRSYLIDEILEKLRAQGARVTFWRPGQTLKVAFLDGDAAWRDTVAAAATEWSRYANIDFTFDSPIEESEIRVTSELEGYWSYAGRNALRVQPPEPTASLPSDPDEDPGLFRAAALRAFGTILGLANEHQLEGATIPWDLEAVYRSYEGAPNHWSREKVDQVIFAQHMGYYPFEKEFDRVSIMMMDVPNELTKGDFEIAHNRELSEHDKKFIARLYPNDVAATR